MKIKLENVLPLDICKILQKGLKHLILKHVAHMSALNVRAKDFFTVNSIVSSKELGKVSQWSSIFKHNE